MRYLFERLDCAPLFAGGPCRELDFPSVVQAQIARIVSARVYGEADNETFGMPAVVSLGASDAGALAAYAARLTRQIMRYEPRLLRPQVELVSGAGALTPYALLVRGTLAPDEAEQVFTFPLAPRTRS